MADGQNNKPSFWRYWRERVRESFMTAYRRAQGIGFIALLIVAVLMLKWPLFPYDKLTVGIVALWFLLALLKEIFFVSPYRHAEKLQAELNVHNDAISKHRGEQARQVLEKAFELLKRPESQLLPFQALYAAGAANLEINEQVVWIANELSEHHEHPLRWTHPYVREDEWLQFLQWGKRHPEFKFDTGADHLNGLVEWAVKHHRGTVEDIGAKALREMTDRSGE